MSPQYRTRPAALRLSALGRGSAAVLCALVSAAALPAQRGKPSFSWDGKELVLDHGKPVFGKHSLDELPAGGTWRLGSNEATVLYAEAPLLAGTAMVAPGAYRAALRRGGEGDLYWLALDYAGWALGLDAAVVELPGTVCEAKPSKRLEVEWVSERGERGQRGGDPSAEVILRATFGPHQLDVPMRVMGSTRVGKLRGFQLTAFLVPADVVASRLADGQPVVVASLHPQREVKDRDAPPFFNVVLRADKIALVPALRAPVESYGFGKLQRFDPAWSSEAPLQAGDAAEEAPVFTVASAALSKEGLAVECAWGNRTAAAVLAIPRGPKP